MRTLMIIARDDVVPQELDSHDFEEYMRRHYRHAYHLAFRMAGNEADAEDLTQEAFLRAYRFFDRYDPRLPFTSWLYRIMTNVYIDEVRKRGKAKVYSLDEPIRSDSSESTVAWEISDPNADPEMQVMEQILEVDLQESLQRLSPEFRWSVILADVEGLSYEEIAETMHCSIGTVRSRIHRGRKQLREFLEKKRPEWKSNAQR
jgi:RNA polymerase sigma-70 factor (ECF subfamily)